MKTITKSIGLVLLLVLNSVAQRAQQEPSARWGCNAGRARRAPAVAPSSSQVATQPNVNSPAATMQSRGAGPGAITPTLTPWS